MPFALGSILAVVFLVIVLNFVMLFIRLKRDRVRRPSKEVMEEAKAVILRDNEIRRQLDREELEAAEYVELRNKTLELYEEVRRRAHTRELEAAETLVLDSSKTTQDDEGAATDRPQ